LYPAERVSGVVQILPPRGTRLVPSKGQFDRGRIVEKQAWFMAGCNPGFEPRRVSLFRFAGVLEHPSCPLILPKSSLRSTA